jgi:3-oxoacyl-[acyl-carrier protein] reductase
LSRDCVRVADAGADTAVNYEENKSAADEVVAAIAKRGRRAIVICADASVPNEVDSMVAAATGQTGEIGILVNNAGVARGRKLDDVKVGKVDLHLVHGCERRGVVGPHYAASKAGMIGLMHSHASQLVTEEMTTNVISHGLVETDMVRSDWGIKADRIPVGRFGRLEEVADVVVMLVRNAYITGQSINVNGGLYPSSKQSRAVTIAAALPLDSRVAYFTEYPVDTLWTISGKFLANLAGKREISTSNQGENGRRKPLYEKGFHHSCSPSFPPCGSFPSWTSPVRPRSPAPPFLSTKSMACDDPWAAARALGTPDTAIFWQISGKLGGNLEASCSARRPTLSGFRIQRP